VGVAGGNGYTGLELLRILSRHDGVEVAWATSRSLAGTPTSIPGLALTDRGPEHLDVDLVFLCLPHGAAIDWMQHARAQNVRVIDLTSDHRPGSGRDAGVVYGMSDLAAPDVRTASVVANPGCYPTGVILSLEPLAAAGLLDSGRPITIAAASGVTGAGRSPRPDLLFAEVAGDYRAYGLGNDHRHLKEMRALLPGLQLLFVPHLLPTARGILETIAVPVSAGVDAARIRAEWGARYADSPTVRVSPGGAPSLRDVVDTDLLVLSAHDNVGLDAPTVTVVAALDNLGKGAAGQAVNNMNLMLGLAADKGLRCRR
jgi:N-acetyl-gamma-glutamyl-phosphate reductase